MSLKLILQICLLATIIISALYASGNIMNDIDRTNARILQLDYEIEEARALRLEIENYSIYTQGYSFIEYIARNWLNMVRRDETIFVIRGD